MYHDLWSNSAAKFYKGLTTAERTRIDDVVRSICTDPISCPGSIALSGELKGKRRVRIGSMRLIYSFDSATKKLFVLTLGNRKDVYR